MSEWSTAQATSVVLVGSSGVFHSLQSQDVHAVKSLTYKHDVAVYKWGYTVGHIVKQL